MLSCTWRLDLRVCDSNYTSSHAMFLEFGVNGVQKLANVTPEQRHI